MTNLLSWLLFVQIYSVNKCKSSVNLLTFCLLSCILCIEKKRLQYGGENMKFRKMLCGTLGLLAIVSLAACGGGDSKSESKADSAKDLAKKKHG